MAEQRLHPYVERDTLFHPTSVADFQEKFLAALLVEGGQKANLKHACITLTWATMNTPGKEPAKAVKILQLEAAWPKRDLNVQQQFSRVKEMAGLEQTPANQDKRRQLSRLLNADLGQALRRGFFGVVRVEVNVQDGTIQQIRHHVERIEK